MNISNNITPIPQIYKRSSVYQIIFEHLHRHSTENGGVSRDKLLEEVKAATNRDEKLLKHSISIVTSAAAPEQGGTAHKSCKAEFYWVEKDGSFLTLKMREVRDV